MKSALAILVPALLLSTGCATTNRRAAGQSPEALFEQERAPEALRVMTFNIQSGRHGLERIAEVIRRANPDVVALQEVDKGTWRSRGLDQAEELAQLTGLTHHAHFRATRFFGGEYGLAVISRFPIVDARRLSLPTPRMDETRAVARAVVDVGGIEVSVYVTHLSHLPQRSALRVEQAQAILRLVRADPRPALLMGDLNDAPSSAAVLLLRSELPCAFSRAGEGPGATYPLPFPLRDLRLDYVLASRAFTPKRAFVVREKASDHFPIVADLDLLPAREALADLRR